MSYTDLMKKRVITTAIVTTLALLGMLGWYFYATDTPDEPKQPTPKVSAIPLYTDKYKVGPPDPQELLELVNKERAKVGVKPLEYDKNVEKSAQLKADDFAERNYYSHTVKGTKYTLTDEMAYYVNLSCKSSGENIAGDMKNSYEPMLGVDSWMDSPPHKKAILGSKYSKTGFGISQEYDGDYFIVQHFCVAK